MCKIRFWQLRDCGGHIFPRKNANFGRFEVAFDRPEFDRTQQCLYLIIINQYLLMLMLINYFTKNLIIILTVRFHLFLILINCKLKFTITHHCLGERRTCQMYVHLLFAILFTAVSCCLCCLLLQTSLVIIIIIIVIIMMVSFT